MFLMAQRLYYIENPDIYESKNNFEKLDPEYEKS